MMIRTAGDRPRQASSCPSAWRFQAFHGLLRSTGKTGRQRPAGVARFSQKICVDKYITEPGWIPPPFRSQHRGLGQLLKLPERRSRFRATGQYLTAGADESSAVRLRYPAPDRRLRYITRCEAEVAVACCLTWRSVEGPGP